MTVTIRTRDSAQTGNTEQPDNVPVTLPNEILYHISKYLNNHSEHDISQLRLVDKNWNEWGLRELSERRKHAFENLFQILSSKFHRHFFPRGLLNFEIPSFETENGHDLNTQSYDLLMTWAEFLMPLDPRILPNIVRDQINNLIKNGFITRDNIVEILDLKKNCPRLRDLIPPRPNEFTDQYIQSVGDSIIRFLNESLWNYDRCLYNVIMISDFFLALLALDEHKQDSYFAINALLCFLYINKLKLLDQQPVPEGLDQKLFVGSYHLFAEQLAIKLSNLNCLLPRIDYIKGMPEGKLKDGFCDNIIKQIFTSKSKRGFSTSTLITRIEKAKEIFELIKDPWYKPECIAKIAVGLIRVHQIDEAMEMANSSVKKQSKGSIISVIAELTHHQFFNNAAKIAHQIPAKQEKNKAYTIIIKGLSERDFFNDAIGLVSKITNVASRRGGINEVYKQIITKLENNQLIESSTLRLTIETMEENNANAENFFELYLALGDFEKANERVLEVKNKTLKNNLIVELIEKLCQNNQIEKAQSLLKELPHRRRSQALQIIENTTRSVGIKRPSSSNTNLETPNPKKR